MRHFWSQTQAFLLFHEVSQLNKFEGAKFKYNDIIFKFHPKDTHRGIFDLKFNDFYFYAKLNAKTNSRMLASNMTIIFSNFSSKIRKSGIFSPQFNDFYFYAKLNAKTNSRTLASNMTIIFSNFSSKIRKSGIFSPQFKDFYFLYQTLQQGKFQSNDCKYGNGFSKLLSKIPK